MRRAAVVLALVLTGAPAWAQMPDLKAMSGKPLPVPEMAAGTISVRVSKQIPMNGVPNVEVSAVLTQRGNDSRKRVAMTGPDGRASFEGVAPGSLFEATASVDGELLRTAKFPVPETGGTRILLIAGLGSGAGSETAPAGEQAFALGSVTGKVAPADGPPGKLEIALVDDTGKPIPGRVVQLGQVGGDNTVRVTRATSDAAGIAHFQDLTTGEGTGYAAVIEHQGMRLGTEAFRMDAAKAMRGEIRALATTRDPSVLRFDNRSKLILEVGEDSLQMMEQLVFKNTSDKIFNPGPEGLLVPLPEGFEGAREFDGTATLEIRAGQGVAVRSPIPPNNGAMFATQIRVGFVVPASGSAAVEIRQPMPFGLEGPLFLIAANAHLTPQASGLRALPDKADAQGNPIKLFEMNDVAPGATLAVTVGGLPHIDRKGRNIAAVICLLLIIAAIAGSPRPRRVAHAVASVEKLAERREKLFAELVTLEQARRQARTDGKRDPDVEARRQELVTRLENVYRELSGVAQGGSATP